MESEQSLPPIEAGPQTFNEKIVELRKRMGFFTFDKTNSGQGYKYVSAAAVIRKLQLEMNALGLYAHVHSEPVHHQAIVLGTDSEDSDEKTASKSHTEKLKTYAVVKVNLQVTDGEGHGVVWQGQGSGIDSGDKAVMKASTAAYKYAIAHGLQLAWGAEDPEGDPSTDGPSYASVKRAIKAAKTPADLEGIKSDLLSLRGDIKPEKYNELAKLFKEKQ